MLISFDRTNFPLIAVEEVGIEAHLLPVTKCQFEQFLAEAGEVSRSHYRQMLRLNPAIPPEELTPDNREQLFVTGILPAEAQAFAEWLGEGFDLPTVKEWRAIYSALRWTLPPRHDLAAELVAGVTGAILAKLTDQISPCFMLDLALMREGVVEWVRHDDGWVGLGAPRPQFHPNLWDPLNHEVRPMQLDERLPYFGFRLVRRGEWYLADRGSARFID